MLKTLILLENLEFLIITMLVWDKYKNYFPQVPQKLDVIRDGQEVLKRDRFKKNIDLKIRN